MQETQHRASTMSDRIVLTLALRPTFNLYIVLCS